MIVKTLNEQPANATHWSSRDLAAQTGMTQSAVSRIWRAFGLKPWLTDGFKLSNDPLFIDKVRDVVAMYLNPSWGQPERTSTDELPARPPEGAAVSWWLPGWAPPGRRTGLARRPVASVVAAPTHLPSKRSITRVEGG